MACRSALYAPKITSAGARSARPFFSKLNKSGSRESDKFFSPNLTIGEPNDKYEKEADSMADHVVNSSNNTSANAVQRKCEKCEEEEKVQKKKEEEEVQLKGLEEEEETVQKKSNTDEEEKDVQMKAAEEEEDTTLQRKESPDLEEEVQTKGEPNHPHGNTLASQLTSNRGNGFALPSQTRNEMEHSFGTDFSGVNIHTDSTAVQMNKDLHAQAFTHGSDIYFNRGKYDTSSAAGKHLLAHELTHVVQQNSVLRKKRIQRQLVFGSGYAGFPSVPDEVAKAKAGKWNPTTIDFSTNAGRSGGGSGAKDLGELINIVGKQGKGAIKKLGIIGHSNSKAMGLSGDVHTQGVPLRGVITEDTLKANKAKIDAIKDRFAAGASIVLYSCNSGGISNGLADVVSEAFGVCVKGFKNDVLWCITFDESPLSITSRGNVFYENPNDPLAGAGVHPSCANFHKKVDDLTPDVNSCKGVPKAAEKKCVSPQDIPVLERSSQFELVSLSENDFASFAQHDSGLEGLTFMDGLSQNAIEKRSRVAQLQERLNHHGASLSPDGMFGQNTLSFLNQFQSRVGLPPTHTVDSRTATALLLPPSPESDVTLISEVEGLRVGDGLIFGTFNLRPRVSRLQQLLTMHGNFTKIDGMFGPKTLSAMNIFQASHDLTTSDTVDRNTADSLEGRSPGLCPFGQIPLTV
jgi:peptidoglycan hydrolase-like protein with peptidoglycan-binding domain